MAGRFASYTPLLGGSIPALNDNWPGCVLIRRAWQRRLRSWFFCGAAASPLSAYRILHRLGSRWVEVATILDILHKLFRSVSNVSMFYRRD